MTRALGTFATDFKLMTLPRKPEIGGRVAVPAFIEAAAQAWEQFGTRTGLPKFNPDGARDAIALRAASKGVVDQAATQKARAGR